MEQALSSWSLDGPSFHAQTETEHVPKLCGFDVELGNFISGLPPGSDSAAMAARLVLQEIAGVSSLPSTLSLHAAAHSYAAAYGYGYGAAATGTDPRDYGRKFLPSNGGSAYIDLGHLELAGPEVLSAFDFVASYHAMLRIARAAMQRANDRLEPGRRIHLLANNSDGHCAYGHHVNVMTTRRAFTSIFERKAHYLGFLASCQAASLPLTGAGKVGADNGTGWVPYQISQRADWFETLTSWETTVHRGVVNSRDENLAGGNRSEVGERLARIHSIFFDAGLTHVSTLLKAGILQVILTLIEADSVPAALCLDDPVDAVHLWSRDLTLRAKAKLVDGREIGALEFQQRLLDHVRSFQRRGTLDAVVPRCAEILAVWSDTVEKLAAGDLESTAARIDWIRKLVVLQRAMARRPDLGWRSPAIRHLDQAYASLALDEGLYWSCEANGGIERLVDDSRIEYFVRNPPEDTRAWTRAMLLRLGHRGKVLSVDWNEIRLRISAGRMHSVRLAVVDTSDPLALARAELEALCFDATSLDEIVEILERKEGRTA